MEQQMTPEVADNVCNKGRRRFWRQGKTGRLLLLTQLVSHFFVYIFRDPCINLSTPYRLSILTQSLAPCQASSPFREAPIPFLLLLPLPSSLLYVPPAP